MLLRRLRWGLAGALVAWTVIRAFGLDRGWPLVPLLAFTPYVTVLAVIAAALAAWRRWWAGALATGVCAVVLIALLAPRAVPDRAPAGAAGVHLRVLSMNVAGDAAAARDVLRQIRGWRPDVVSLLELPPRAVAAYDAAGIGSVLPEQVLRPLPGFSGTGLYSRLPLRRLPPPPGTLFGIAAAQARLPGGVPVDLLSVHVPAPTSRGAERHWRHDLRALPAAGAAPAPPRVLAGDFNATLDHAELRSVLDRGYRDASEQAGAALRPTWPAGRRVLPPLVTIDHVLADRRIRVISARSVPIFGSDHRGILADLLVPGDDRAGG
jgi:endonuclease/exonuclease/phosphatase (EEP) superfamily protein YafD